MNRTQNNSFVWINNQVVLQACSSYFVSAFSDRPILVIDLGTTRNKTSTKQARWLFLSTNNAYTTWYSYLVVKKNFSLHLFNFLLFLLFLCIIWFACSLAHSLAYYLHTTTSARISMHLSIFNKLLNVGGALASHLTYVYISVCGVRSPRVIASVVEKKRK